MNLKKFNILSICSTPILMSPFFISCTSSSNENKDNLVESKETKAKPNLIASELGLSGTINDNKNIINKEWIISNKQKLFIGNIDNLNNVNQIINLDFNDGEDQRSLIVNLKLTKGSTFGSNQQPTTSDTNFKIIINGFELKKYPQTILKNNLTASALGLSGTAESSINIINNQWILENKANIFDGTLEFLTSSNQINNISTSVDTNNATILNVSFTLKAGSFVGEDQQISVTDKSMNLKISGFNEISQNYQHTQPKSDLTADTFGFSGTINKNKSRINAQWILTNRAKIFNGTIDLINSPNQITNITISNADNDTKMILKFTLAANSFINEQNQISQTEKLFEISITGFTTPLPQTTINQNLTASTFNFSGTAKSNVGHITNEWIFNNKDTIFVGTNNLITKKEDITISEIEFSIKKLTRMKINILLAPKTSVNPSGDISEVSTSFSIIIDNFAMPTETKLKTNITASSLNLNGTVGDNIKTMTINNQTSIDNINMDKNWILSNINNFFDGTTDSIDSNSILNAETIANPTFTTTNNGQQITNFTFSLELKSYSIYNANGDFVKERQTFNITITNFENVSTSFTYNPKYVFANKNQNNNEDINTVMNSIDRNYIFENYKNIINSYYRTNIYGEEYCKEIWLTSSYQIESVNVVKNKDQLPWKDYTENEIFYPKEPDENTQLRVEIILSKNVFLDENNTWNSQKACILFYIFFDPTTTN